MSKLSDFLTSTAGPGQIQLTAGGVVSQNDTVLLLGVDGRAYPAAVTDNAVVSAAGTAVLASTAIFTTAGSGGAVNYHRDPQVQLGDGSIALLTPNDTTNGYGLVIRRYSAAGAPLNSVILDSSSLVCYDPNLVLLSNGSVAAAWTPTGGSGLLTYAVLDAALNSVKAPTTIEQPGQENCVAACALSGGGFALAYHAAASAGVNQRLAIYDNTGTVVSAPATIFTFTGTTNNVYPRIGQLSNGNIVVALTSAYSGSLAAFMGIYSAAGASVLAMASIGAISAAVMPELSIMAGYFAIARGDNTSGLKAYVYSNAGALQGAAFAPASSTNNSALTNKLLNDGTAFWLVWNQVSDTSTQLTKMPTTGTGYVSTNITASTTSYAKQLDAFYERGQIVIAYANSGSAQGRFFTVSLTASPPTITVNSTLYGTVAAAGSYLTPSIMPTGDFTFGWYTAPSAGGTAHYYGTMKYASASIIGLALAAATAGVSVPVQPLANAYGCNTIKGTPKAFDHTAAAVLGNKGVFYPTGGLILKGIV